MLIDGQNDSEYGAEYHALTMVRWAGRRKTGGTQGLMAREGSETRARATWRMAENMTETVVCCYLLQAQSMRKEKEMVRDKLLVTRIWSTVTRMEPMVPQAAQNPPGHYPSRKHFRGIIYMVVFYHL